MYVYVFPRGVRTLGNGNYRVSDEIINERKANTRLALVDVLIHELAHAAGKNTAFSHQEMDIAAMAVDPTIRATTHGDNNDDSDYFNQFVSKWCGVSVGLTNK